MFKEFETNPLPSEHECMSITSGLRSFLKDENKALCISFYPKDGAVLTGPRN